MRNQRRYVVTVGAVLLYYLFSYIPLFKYPAQYAFPEGNPALGLFSLGPSPIYSGFWLVELVSFVIPPFRRWRNEGLEGRRKIHLFQIALMVLIAAIQGWFSGQLINSLDPNHPLEILGISGLAAQIILCSCLVNGVLIFYLLATNVTQYGLVNGFILFLFIRPLVSKTFDLLKGIQVDLRLLKMSGSFPGWPTGLHFLSFDEKMNFIYILLALTGAGFILFKKRNKILNFIYQYVLRRPTLAYRTPERTYEVKVSPVPQTITGGLGILVMIFLILRPLHGFSTSDEFWWNMGCAGTKTVELILSSWLLWLLFTNAYWVNYHLEGRATWQRDRSKLRPYFIFWLVVMAITGFLNEPFLYSFNSLTLKFLKGIVLEPIFILTMVVLAVEMIEKWKFDQKANQSVCLAEMDNVELVQLWVAQLEAANVSFHVEGLRYRQLMQFFAPYLKMRLFVVESQAQEAASIIRLAGVKQI